MVADDLFSFQVDRMGLNLLATRVCADLVVAAGDQEDLWFQ